MVDTQRAAKARDGHVAVTARARVHATVQVQSAVEQRQALRATNGHSVPVHAGQEGLPLEAHRDDKDQKRKKSQTEICSQLASRKRSKTNKITNTTSGHLKIIVFPLVLRTSRNFMFFEIFEFLTARGLETHFEKSKKM